MNYALFLVSGFLFLCPGIARGNEIFNRLTIDNGLAHTDATCIAQDSTGMIWIGTFAGLQSYDGYTLRTYDYYLEDHKIYQSHNRTNTIAATRNRLWIGTESGLTCFDLDTNRYIPFNISGNAGFREKTPVQGLFLNGTGTLLWIRNAEGLFGARYDGETLHVLEWTHEGNRNYSRWASLCQTHARDIWGIANSLIIRLGPDEGGINLLDYYTTDNFLRPEENLQTLFHTQDFLYLRTDRGCYCIPIVDNRLDKSRLVYTDFHSVNPNIPEQTNGRFAVSREGTLWCAYSGGLLEVQQPFTGNTVIREHLKSVADTDLSKQKTTGMLVDKYNNLWITMSSWGVFYRPISASSFRNISQQDFRDLGFLQNEINSIVAHPDGTLWMLVESGSLFRYDPVADKLTLMPLRGVSMRNVFLQHLNFATDRRHLYIGTSSGIIIYDTQTGNARELSSGSGNLKYSITKIAEDGRGRLWITTWGNGVLCVGNPLSNPTILFHLTQGSPQPILSNLISDMLIQQEAVLLCTTNGLNRIILSSSGEVSNITGYQTDPLLPFSMSTDYLASIDSAGGSEYWIGTIGGGLNKVVIHSERANDYTSTNYTTRNGLTTNDCEIVFVDGDNHVWIGGNSISRLDTDTGHIYTYGATDGLQNNAFKIGSGYKDSDGTIYMGGLYGLSFFNPASVMQREIPGELVFTELFVNNESIVPAGTYGKHVILDETLNKTSNLTLRHDQNNFAVSFAALGYAVSEQIMYRYRIAGFQEEWQTLRYFENQIAYTNLPYGKYRLDVELSTDKGYSWQEPGRSLTISVRPPWWQTVWAKIAYALIAISLVVIGMYQYNRQQKLKRENEIQKIKMAGDKEQYQSKMQFFMNASHELKTPLTLIQLSGEKLQAGPSVKEGEAIVSNSRKMLSLISELVEIRKADIGVNDLTLSSLNVSRLTRRLFEQIVPWAEKKKIKVTYASSDEAITMDADADKMGKLIINLLSNAIKYTPEGGRIDISLGRGSLNNVKPHFATIHQEGSIMVDSEAFILTVRDSGVGISPESIRQIYERFFQVPGEDTSHLGSGIGLAIAKSAVLQHKGVIIVSSERMVGSEFIVVMPIRNECPESENATDGGFDAGNFIGEQYNEFLPGLDNVCKVPAPYPSTDSGLPTLLLVEDNKELQSSLKEHLSTEYSVYTADNGRMGLEMCEELYPDIIITDVMMPEMDGLEMCRRIKDNLSLAYIPIVMLTAKDSIESQIEGYETDVDLYIPKPFSVKLLDVNLRRLLTQREKWFKGNRSQVKNKAAFSNETHKFERSLMEEVERNIDNPDFSVDTLAATLGMSRTKLYNKLKEVSAEPLSDMIRNMRLEKAAYLLIHSQLNISEIMDETGFINSSHFSKVFKLKYGTAPSEYKKSTL